MRTPPLPPELLIANRRRLRERMLPNALAVLNSNDILPTNADGTLLLRQNSDLYYLTGVDQEETILLLFPDADDESCREILFLREHNDLISTWEGDKLTKEEARRRTGIARIEWLSNFWPLFHRLMCECERVYLNSNEHKRAVIEVESRDARFVRDTIARYPLHEYHRLARLLHPLRAVKSDLEIELLRKASDLTGRGFRRVLRYVRPGVNEREIEAEFAHEFIRHGGDFAYSPIIASGANACILHYAENKRTCRNGDLLLLDVGASHARYNADLTRTIPVNGRFTRRQKQVYQAVLRVLRHSIGALRPGLLHKDWQQTAERLMQEELVGLGLLRPAEIRKQDPERPAFKKYFMHGLGHPLGLDVHDVGFVTEPMQAGWVLTVEPGIYIREEGFAVRLENDVLVTENGPVDLMADIPIEIEEIEELMLKGRAGKARAHRGRR